MADNKKKKGAADPSKVSSSEGYEVNYFATKHRISSGDARKLISKIGNNRTKLNAAAEKISESRPPRGARKSPAKKKPARK